MSQRGAINLPMIIAVALGLGFGASAFLNYSQYQRTQQDKKLLNGEITDLKYQVEQDRLASGSSPTPSPSPSDSASPSPQASATPTPTTAVLAASGTAMTLNTSAKMHTAPSTTAPLVFPNLLPRGTSVTVTGDAASGYKSVTVNGKTGYIKASYLQ